MFHLVLRVCIRSFSHFVRSLRSYVIDDDILMTSCEILSKKNNAGLMRAMHTHVRWPNGPYIPCYALEQKGNCL